MGVALGTLIAGDLVLTGTKDSLIGGKRMKAIPCKHCGQDSIETNPPNMHNECSDCIAEPPAEAQRAYEHAIASAELR